MANNNRDLRVRDESSPMSRSAFQDFDQLVDRFFNSPFSSIWGGMPAISQRNLGEIKETDEAYIMTVDLPGIPQENVDVSVNGNILTIRAEQNTSNERSGTSRSEYRSYNQSFSIPSTIDASKVEAHCDHGLLEVWLPKAESARAHKIQVQSGKSGFGNRITSAAEKTDARDETAGKKH